MNRGALLILLVSVATLFGQEQKPAVPISPSARLAAAKTAYVKNGGGNDIPFNVISNGIDGWGRFVTVDSPDQADIVIEVLSVADPNQVTVDSSDSLGHKSSKKVNDEDVEVIKLTVYDAKTHLPLWAGNERPKGGFKEKTRDDNLVQAAAKLLTRFRERLEPPQAEAAPDKPKQSP